MMRIYPPGFYATLLSRDKRCTAAGKGVKDECIRIAGLSTYHFLSPLCGKTCTVSIPPVNWHLHIVNEGARHMLGESRQHRLRLSHSLIMNLKKGGPGRDRTYDQPVMSRPLYR